MILQKKTLEKLRLLINEEIEYRSGSQLVAFFKSLGFSDSYGQGFPSRWVYTDERLSQINSTPQLDQCIKRLFAPINFIGKYDALESFIKEFNEYLVYDGWEVICEDAEIRIREAGKPKINFSTESDEIEFLSKEFSDIKLECLNLDGVITNTLVLRLEEIKKCIGVNAPLSVIFLTGSSLEGILLGVVSKFPKLYNQSAVSPKDNDGKVLPFFKWTLNDFINAAHDVGHLNEDVKKFSHALRSFRNYIHPYQQVSSKFNPDEHTARICWQVLKAAIYQLSNNCK